VKTPRTRLTMSGSKPLDAYQRAFADSNGPVGDQITVRIEMVPGDEIGRVSVRVPSRLLGCSLTGPLVRIAARRRDSVRMYAPAITELEARGPSSSVSCARVQACGSDSYVDIWCDVPEGKLGDLEITCLAWEIVNGHEGDAPYLHAALGILLDFPAFPDVPVLVTIVVPQDAEPRSIQGSHVLAYPSRTFQGRRHLNLYFQRDRTIRLSASFGPTNDVAEIWLGFAKLAGAAALVAFVGSLRAAPSDTERLLAVLASLATLLGVSSGLLRQFAELRIYRHVGRFLQGTLLAAQTVGILIILLSLLRLKSGSNGGLYGAVVPLAGVLAGLTALATIGGLLLHRLGFWHGFVCDFEGCRNILRIRAGRPECRYTGRVFCDAHIQSVCDMCRHGSDLRSGRVDTASAFDYVVIPCRAAPQATATCD
jgi:hypothetical protein